MLIWEVFRCPGCGGTAKVAVMSAVARCECGAVMACWEGLYGTYHLHKYEWFIPKEGSD